MRFRRVLALLLLASFLTLGVLWKTGWLGTTLDDFFRNRLVKGYIERLQPKLPFTIESFETDRDWNLTTTLRWNGWRVRLRGPIRVSSAEKMGGEKDEYLGSYKPEATFETVEGGEATRSGPLQLSLRVQVSSNLTRLTELGLTADARSFEWKLFGVQSEAPALEVGWRRAEGSKEMKAPLLFKLSAKSLAWTDPAHTEHALNILDPRFDAETVVGVDPFVAGPEVAATIRARSGEMLWDERYVEIPFAAASPVRARAQVAMAPAPALKSVDVTFGSAETVRVGFDGKTVKWKARALPLAELMRLALTQPETQSLAGLEVKAGTLTTQGQLELAHPEHVSGTLEVKKADLDFRPAAAALRGFSASIPFSGLETRGARIESDHVYFKRFEGKLGSMPIIFAGQRLELPEGIPLQLDGLPLTLGPVAGSFKSVKQFRLLTKIKLRDVPAPQLAEGMCLKGRIPPATVSADLNEIEVTPGLSLDVTGSVRAVLFGGFIEIDEMGFFDLGREVPEIDFSSRWDGIRLAELGKWLNFGHMDGMLTGYAKEVTFQSWLPTYFDFRSEMKPHKKSKVQFSPLAMKNFVSLFAGDGLSQIPGFAQWVMFGWPARLFDGYDINYAGASLFSRDGAIMLETLDPPDKFGLVREHFILAGSRFNMPLKSSHYPLIMDSTALSNFARHMYGQLANLSASNQEKTGHETDEKPCIPSVY